MAATDDILTRVGNANARGDARTAGKGEGKKVIYCTVSGITILYFHRGCRRPWPGEDEGEGKRDRDRES